MTMDSNNMGTLTLSAAQLRVVRGTWFLMGFAAGYLLCWLVG